MDTQELNDFIGQKMIEFILDDKMPEDIKLSRLTFLLDKGPDVNAQMYGKSLLTHTKEKLKNKKFEDLLVVQGAKEWVISEEEALELGRQFWDNDGKLKSAEIIEELLVKGANVNAKSDYDRIALMDASEYNRKDIAELLIENGADVNEENFDGWTALILASQEGYKEVAELLIENGADVNVKDYRGLTALMWASQKAHKEVVELLIAKGADVNAKNDNGWTALMEASGNGRKEVTELLIAKGADVNAKTRYGETALTSASEKGYEEIVEFLAKAEEESKAKLKEDMKEDAKSLSNDKDKKNNTKGGFWNRIFGGNDRM